MNISTKQLTVSYTVGSTLIPIIKQLDMDIASGEFVVLSGKSGAGKSTLLYQLSLLSRPTSGTVHIDNMPAQDMSNAQRSAFRLKHFGFIFQDFALSRDLSAVDNVALPLLCLGYGKSHAIDLAAAALQSVDMQHRADNYPEQLSGGEQQRVAIARAVVTRPQIVFADEPTASLDTENSEKVLQIISDLHKNSGITVVMITHEEQYKSLGDRIIELQDGQIISQ